MSRNRGSNAGTRSDRSFGAASSGLDSRIGTENPSTFNPVVANSAPHSGTASGPTYNARGQNNSRGRRGAGSGKRGGGVLRGPRRLEDKDGDLEMGATPPSTPLIRQYVSFF